MLAALGEARLAPAHGDVPIGAVVLAPDGRVIGAAHNERELTGDPTAHAEILAIRRAAQAPGRRAAQAPGRRPAQAPEDWRLTGCTLVVTLEPCTMCAGAVVASRLARLVFGAFDVKAGAVASLWDVVRDPRLNHRPDVVGGYLAEECADLIRQFFGERR